MTKHIVFFKFKAEVSENVRTSAFKAFKDGIERLPSEIPFIREVLLGETVTRQRSGMFACILCSTIWRM